MTAWKRLLTALATAVSLSSAAPAAQPSNWQPPAMRSFLAFSADAAATQFRGVGTPHGPQGQLQLASAADLLFPAGSDRCELWAAWSPPNRIKLICGPSDVFGNRATFKRLIAGAMPAGFKRVACPDSAAIVGQTFLGCTRRSDGVEIESIAQAGIATFKPPVPETYAVRVVAPPPVIQRAARAQALARIVAAATASAGGSLNADAAERFVTRAAGWLRNCEISAHASGRSVMTCTPQFGSFASETDFQRAFGDALGAAHLVRAPCAQAVYGTSCGRDARGVEVAIGSGGWPFAFSAYDGTVVDGRIAKVRDFFGVVLPPAGNGFRGYDPKRALAFFGDCAAPKPFGARSFITCSSRQDTFDGRDDFAAVVTAALPQGYATRTCTMDVSKGEGYVGDTCFGGQHRPEIELGSDDAGFWVIWVLTP